jgi:hypothetical protein
MSDSVKQNRPHLVLHFITALLALAALGLGLFNYRQAAQKKR